MPNYTPLWVKRNRDEQIRYWTQRRQQLVEQMERDEGKLNEKLASIYSVEERKLEREIRAFYAEYGEKDVIEYRKLLQSLSEEDLILLMEKMDDFAEKYPQYAHLMPVREKIYVLDRLEGLQYSIWLQQLKIGAIEQELFESHLRKYAMRAANLAAEELGFGKTFYSINDSLIREVINKRWAQGKNFSDDIWNDTEKVASILCNDLALGFARGVKFDEMAKMLADKFHHDRTRNAKRLVYTEGTFVLNEAQAMVHEKEFDSYQMIYITERGTDHPDSKVCVICEGVVNYQKTEPVRFEDRMPGVNFPPLHPWCRCNYLVVVDDWEDWIERYVARHGGDYIQERDRPDLNYLHPEVR